MTRVCLGVVMAVLLMVSVTSATADTWYVKPESDPPRQTHDGNAWSTAYTTIEDALAVAQSGDEVWVAEGTYSAESGTFEVPEGVLLFGGFYGTESQRDDRDWAAHTTTLSGWYISATGSSTEQSAIDGFTIFECYVFDLSGNVIFSHNIVTGCFEPEVGYLISCSGPVKLANNLIYGNPLSVKGEGGYTFYCDGTDSILVNNTIVGNGSLGGGVVTSNGVIANNIIAFSNSWGIGYDEYQVLLNNCVYGNALSEYMGTPLEGWTIPPTEVNDDPLFADLASNDFHLLSTSSPCWEAGANAAIDSSSGIPEFARSKDLDGRDRIQGDYVDIGAYEYLDTTPPAAPTAVFLDLLVTSTGKLHASWTAPSDSDLAGYDYKITYLDRFDNEYTPVNWQSCSETDIKYNLTLSQLGRYTFHVRAKDTAGNIGPEASNAQPVQSWGGRVGFCYDLCVDTTSKTMIENFLLDEILSFSSDVVYSSTNSRVSWTNQNDEEAILNQLNQFNVIILALPNRNLTSAENEAMEQFTNGFQKRLVFVADTKYYSTQIQYLQNAINAQGLTTTLWTNNSFDTTQDYTRHCSVVSQGICVTDGVNYLWDWGCGGMQNTNAIFMSPNAPFIVGAATKNNQVDLKNIVVSDRDIFNRVYGPKSTYNPSHYAESISQANARFMANLCTKW